MTAILISGSPPEACCHNADRPEISVTGFIPASPRRQRSFTAVGRPSDENSCDVRELSRSLSPATRAFEEAPRGQVRVESCASNVRNRQNCKPLTPRTDPK
jgi:hypothetical protein